MRATINFEVDVGRVNETMLELVSTQVEYLIDAAEFIRKDALPSNLLEVLSKNLEKIEKEAAQLRQYRDMLVNFEKARFETMLPQPAPPAAAEHVGGTGEDQQNAARAKQFEDFLGKINRQEPEEEHDDTEEG